jgi:Predicted membrane protein (DUF2207)
VIGRQIRRIPAVVLIVLLSILTLRAWLDVGDDPLTVSSTADGLTSVTWAASVSATGRLAISVRYAFDDAIEHRLDVFVPDGARFLTINGTPVSASNGTNATAQVSSSATVAYELPGAVTRYRDGALLRLVRINGTSLDGNQGLFSCPRCLIDPIGYGDTPVYGALAVPGADEVHPEFIGLHSVRAAADRNEMRFVGIDTSTGDVAMIAVLPVDSVLGLTVRDGTVAQALAAVKSELKPSGEVFHSPHRPVHGEHWAAVALSAMLGLIVVWIAARLIWAVGSRAASRAARPLAGQQTFADARSVRPTDLEPALAGAVVGAAVKGERSVVAATIVELARRNVVEFTGNDSRRFSLIVPAEATGSTRFEQAVIDSLRLDDDPPVLVERTSPHLWGDRSGTVTKRLRKALLRATLREKLVRVSVPALGLVPMTIAMGAIAIVGTTGGVKFAWFVAVVGPLLALATVASAGLVLTAKGRSEQAHWTEYAAWLHTNDSLAQAEPWAVSNYGEVLAYATALGAAPEVVRCLSPDRKKRT